MGRVTPWILTVTIINSSVAQNSPPGVELLEWSANKMKNDKGPAKEQKT